MTRRVYVYFALTFLLGVVVGGAGVFYYAWHWGHWRHGFSKERLVRRLSRDLKLSDEQVQQLNQIYDDSEKQYGQLQQQIQPQAQALRQQTTDRIRKILNPDQAAKFEEIVRRREEERMRRRRGP
jgi:hypothetical protein